MTTDRISHHIAVALLTMAASVTVRAGNTASEAGRQIYREGRLADGRPLVAVVQGDVHIEGTAAACISCHRRSGLGSAEGSAARALPVIGSALFTARTGAMPRPAYTRESLAATLASGITPSGRRLDALMPRYQLAPRSLDALVAYLRDLGSAPPPGVTDDELVLATVIGADAPAAERTAVERVLARFVEIKNAGSRQDARRSAAARRHQLGERRDRAWRRWRLVTWQVSGPPAGWPAQLQRQYAADTPFALLSGTTGHDWQVVHAFCEQRGLPCILPLTDAPPDADRDYYSLYYSDGARLEARVTLADLARQLTASDQKVLLLTDGSAAARAARDSLLAGWQEAARPASAIRAVTLPPTANSNDWQRLLDKERPAAVVAWLDAAQLQPGVDALAALQASGTLLYTAEHFSDWEQAGALAGKLAGARHVYPFQLRRGSLAQFPREQVWLRTHGVGDLDVRVAGRVLFACHAVGEVLVGIESNFSRDYFMETLEHMLDDTSMTTLYPRTTLGPGQRYLSRGAYLVSPTALLAGDSLAARWVSL